MTPIVYNTMETLFSLPNDELEDYFSQDYVQKLMTYPRSRIAFITIRCPQQVLPWIKLSKATDWMRRYSKTFYAVRGTKGGFHIHILAGIEKQKTLVPKKGIHFDISYLYTKDPVRDYHDYDEERDSRNMAIYHKQQAFNEATLNLTETQSEIIRLQAQAVTKYWKSRSRLSKSIEKKNAKRTKVDRILRYMAQNLAEPREDDNINRYRDYFCKY